MVSYHQCTAVNMYIRIIYYRRLLVMPREVNTNEGKVKSLGVFVQCNPKSPESA